jgi:hypothetical protein
MATTITTVPVAAAIGIGKVSLISSLSPAGLFGLGRYSDLARWEGVATNREFAVRARWSWLAGVLFVGVAGLAGGVAFGGVFLVCRAALCRRIVWV